jgi:pimeloyl-ACP methyl ester carboxylesterase
LTLVAPGLTGYEWPRLPGFARRMAAAEAGDAHCLAVEIARLWAPLSFPGDADDTCAEQPGATSGERTTEQASTIAGQRTTQQTSTTEQATTTAVERSTEQASTTTGELGTTDQASTATGELGTTDRAAGGRPGTTVGRSRRPRDAAAQIIVDQAEAFMRDEMEIEEPSAVDRLGEINAPTLVVLGDRDVAPVTDIGRRLADGVPGARQVTVAGADHMLPLRVPERLTALLLEHLAAKVQPA